MQNAAMIECLREPIQEAIGNAFGNMAVTLGANLAAAAARDDLAPGEYARCQVLWQPKIVSKFPRFTANLLAKHAVTALVVGDAQS